MVGVKLNKDFPGGKIIQDFPQNLIRFFENFSGIMNQYPVRTIYICKSKMFRLLKNKIGGGPVGVHDQGFEFFHHRLIIRYLFQNFLSLLVIALIKLNSTPEKINVP